MLQQILPYITGISQKILKFSAYLVVFNKRPKFSLIFFLFFKKIYRLTSEFDDLPGNSQITIQDYRFFFISQS